MEDNVVLVNKNDKQVGLLGKFKAHQGEGKLHRAITAVLYDKDKILIQKRSKNKPLWPMFWDGTCSTHPIESESYEECARRRLAEEMGVGIDKKVLKVLYKFYYQAKYNEQLSEHEVNAVVIGEYKGSFKINRYEVKEAKWVKWSDLLREIDKSPKIYAPWFKMMIKNKKLINIFER